MSKKSRERRLKKSVPAGGVSGRKSAPASVSARPAKDTLKDTRRDTRRDSLNISAALPGALPTSAQELKRLHAARPEMTGNFEPHLKALYTSLNGTPFDPFGPTATRASIKKLETVTFEGAEQVLTNLSQLVRRFPEIATACLQWPAGQLHNAGFLNEIVLDLVPKMLNAHDEGKVDVVLWERSSVQDAMECSDFEAGTEPPAEWETLLPRCQWHMYTHGSMHVGTDEQDSRWGLDVPCSLTGWCILPMEVELGNASNLQTEGPIAEQSRARWGMAAFFIFTPVRTHELADMDAPPKELVVRQIMPRIRMLPPCVQGLGMPSDLNEMAALLNFMGSNKSELKTALVPRPIIPNAKRSRRTPADGENGVDNGPRVRTLVLRRVRTLTDEQQAEQEDRTAQREAAGTKRTLEEAHKVPAHYRMVACGPGRRDRRRVKIAEHWSPADPNLPRRETDHLRIHVKR